MTENKDDDLYKAIANEIRGSTSQSEGRTARNEPTLTAPYGANPTPQGTVASSEANHVGQRVGGEVGKALSGKPPLNVAGYEQLYRILKLAYDQAASGKGKERHSVGPVGFRAWEDQPILANARQVGPGGPALQVMKKIQEAVTMAGNGNFTGAKAETLGAVVYAAAMFKLLEEMELVPK